MNKPTLPRLMDNIAALSLCVSLASLGTSFYLSNDLAGAVSFGVFVSCFVGAISAFSVGHLALRKN